MILRTNKPTLIMHTADASTDFLKRIYSGDEFLRKTVVNWDMPESALKPLIASHDNIVMLGHGTPSGLLNGSWGGYNIDESYVPLLRDKTLIGIWCNASEFAKRHNLPGLWSGMFISEISEAITFLDENCKQDRIDALNNNFADTLSSCLNWAMEVDLDKVASYIKAIGRKEGEDVITQYNYSKLVSFNLHLEEGI